MNDRFKQERERMVYSQIEARGVRDLKTLAAMKKVPREEFIGINQWESAFYDGPLPIGCGQTISQPYIVAYMTELLELEGTEKVLELGTGCGYQTAVLAEIASQVYTVEVIADLAEAAEERLMVQMKYTNIHFKTGNGREGWLEHAPFDRIIVTAAPRQFPEALFLQLAEGGIAVAPIGDYFQRMMRYRKLKNGIQQESLIGVAFVPFV